MFLNLFDRGNPEMNFLEGLKAALEKTAYEMNTLYKNFRTIYLRENFIPKLGFELLV